MKNESKVKKLVLRKETLRDLTAQNAGQIKGNNKTNLWATCPYACLTGLTCLCPTVLAASCGCHGNTRNKKCGL